MIARHAFLLVSVFVFLIDEDQAEIRQRRKHRRTRADDDARLALANAMPFVEALALRKMRMQNCHLVLHCREA